MILLLGANSYVGQAFARALRWRKDAFIPLAPDAFDYTRFEFLFDYLRKIRPELLINAEQYDGPTECWSNGTIRNGGNGAGGHFVHPGPGNAPPAPFGTGAVQSERMDMLRADVLLPQTIARACALTNTRWGHVSSGSIYSGAKVTENGRVKIEEDLSLPANRALFARHPEKFSGFTELDAPNFSFKSPSCTFYSGSKALAEESLQDTETYIWRLRLPFNEQDEPRNFLSQLQDGWKLHDAINSLSQLDDCVGACLELWERRAPFGVYNVVNPGALLTRDIVQMIRRVLKPQRRLQLLQFDNESNDNGDKLLAPDCILDPGKLLRTGIRLRPVQEAIDKALAKWQRHNSSAMRTSA